MFSWSDSPGPSRLQRRPGEKPHQEERRASSWERLVAGSTDRPM